MGLRTAHQSTVKSKLLLATSEPAAGLLCCLGSCILDSAVSSIDLSNNVAASVLAHLIELGLSAGQLGLAISDLKVSI
jgi:hypothetical protein